MATKDQWAMLLGVDPAHGADADVYTWASTPRQWGKSWAQIMFEEFKPSKPERQHISDAAWERYTRDTILHCDRSSLEAEYSADGIMLVTVEEWERKKAAFPPDLAAKDAEIASLREQLVLLQSKYDAADAEVLMWRKQAMERFHARVDQEIAALEAEYKERQHVGSLLLQSPALEPTKLGRGNHPMLKGV